MKKIFFMVFGLLLTVTTAHAAIHVVATLPWIGSIVRELGGDKVQVTVLVKPSQDPHIIDAKPSFILAARKADVFMYNGLDLEIGYLPLIVESSRNAKLQPGKPGNFDCSRFVTVVEKNSTVDRSLGDVHPLGNPHYQYSPTNVQRVAEGIADRLAQLDGTHTEFFQLRLKAFSENMKQLP
jgi:zinc/manganese transport system substrate-binding protein